MWSEVLELTLTGCGDTGINTDCMRSEILELTLTGCGVLVVLYCKRETGINPDGMWCTSCAVL